MRYLVAACQALVIVVWLPVAPASGAGVSLVPVASGFARPVFVTHAGDGSGRLFVGLQGGKVLVVRGPSVSPTPFLDISSSVSCCGERGLLGLAFHPGYRENGLFFVDYTDSDGNTVVSRFRVSDDPDRGLPVSETVLLRIVQPFGNHNGGQLAFGPDGYLYIGTGDGGSAGDPGDNARNTESLLGKLLRIDVDGGDPYGIPPDNPFAGPAPGRDEIWAYGLRNPWRFSFDRVTGDLFIADVGQNAWEEVNYQPRGEPGGRNYGWRTMEGTHCFNPSSGCSSTGSVLPVVEYGHDKGCSVTGGYVYRGKMNAPLSGTYFFGDFCSGRIWGARPAGKGLWIFSEFADTELSISTFGEDEEGELLVADYRPENGTIYRVTAPLVISPPSGRYVDGQALEPTLIVHLGGQDVSAVTATLDGGDVVTALASCVQAANLTSGGRAYRCAGIRGGQLDVGPHRFEVGFDLADGSRVADGVTWEVLESSATAAAE